MKLFNKLALNEIAKNWMVNNSNLRIFKSIIILNLNILDLDDILNKINQFFIKNWFYQFIY